MTRDELAAKIYAETIMRLDSPTWETQEEMLEHARGVARGAINLADIFEQELGKVLEDELE